MNVIDTVRKKCVTFVFKNAGLLLIAASQGFLALMNVAVKKLNTIDPPVPPLEVCISFQLKLLVMRSKITRDSAYRYTDGALYVCWIRSSELTDSFRE